VYWVFGDGEVGRRGNDENVNRGRRITKPKEKERKEEA